MFEPNFAIKIDNKEFEIKNLTYEEEGIAGTFLMYSKVGYKNVNIIQLYKCLTKEYLNQEYPIYNCVLNNVLVFSTGDYQRAKKSL